MSQPVSFAQQPHGTAAAAQTPDAVVMAAEGGGMAPPAAEVTASDGVGDGGAAALISYLKQQLGAGGHLLLVWTRGGTSDAD